MELPIKGFVVFAVLLSKHNTSAGLSEALTFIVVAETDSFEFSFFSPLVFLVLPEVRG